jgi:molecular chaperone GrpE
MVDDNADILSETQDTDIFSPNEEQVEDIQPVEQTIEEELDQLRAQAQEYLDGWQRARAELANARRRFERERAEAGQYASAELVRKLLPVCDDFERALSTIPQELRSEGWIEGIFLIHRKLQVVIESVGVRPITVQPGDMFDPSVHEAVTHEEANGYPSGAVIAEIQKGYRLGEGVLRPALVRVAK